MVPVAFRNNTASCMIAVEIAERVGASALAVAQSLHVIHGRPSWSAQFIIGVVNSSGRFKHELRFRTSGEGDDKTVTAWTVDRSTGEVIEGPGVSIRMAKAEKWIDKPGSKWQTMPDLMQKYRAATFFGRLYCSDIILGMQSTDEVHDIIDVTPSEAPAVNEINDKINKAKRANAPAEEIF